jgi:hypothetical protein
MRTVAVLIMACPCALILAADGDGGRDRRSGAPRSVRALRCAGAKVDTVVFGKTGTITEGSSGFARWATDRTGDELLAVAAAVEGVGPPLARVVVQERSGAGWRAWGGQRRRRCTQRWGIIDDARSAPAAQVCLGGGTILPHWSSHAAGSPHGSPGRTAPPGRSAADRSEGVRKAYRLAAPRFGACLW